jgi:hypothetical protein
MLFRTIKRNDTSFITPHFRNNEFYSSSARAGYPVPDSHELAQPVISAVEYLRCRFNVPWRVTSTYRTEAHELAICEKRGYSKQLAKGSMHVAKRAIDSQPIENAEDIILTLHEDFLNRGEIFTQLRELGITGFGIYDTFIHLDCRDTETVSANQHDPHGHFAFWDERTDAVKKKLVTFKTKPTPTKKAPLPSPVLASARKRLISPGY